MLLGFENIIKKITSSKGLFQKLHFKAISLLMTDKFAIVIGHTISSLEINEGKGGEQITPAGTTVPQKARV